MGLPKYLMDQIKALIKCCTNALTDRVTTLEGQVNPASDEFLIARPNGETFDLDGDGKAIVATNDIEAVSTEYFTGQNFFGERVYQRYEEIDLETSPGAITLFAGVDKVLDIEIHYLDFANDVVVPMAYENALPVTAPPDLTIEHDVSTNDFNMSWGGGPYAAGDKLYVFVKYTKVPV